MAETELSREALSVSRALLGIAGNLTGAAEAIRLNAVALQEALRPPPEEARRVPVGRRVYVASSWRNAVQPQVVAALREAGHDVYDFKNPRPGDQGFHWSEIDPAWKDWTVEQYRDALVHPIAEAGFHSDFDAMKWADTFVLVLPCGRSAHLELGWACGVGKEAHILSLEPCEPELMAKMISGTIHSTIESVVGVLRPHATKEAAPVLDASHAPEGYHAETDDPTEPGWYECLAVDDRWGGGMQYRAWGNGLWWTPLSDGWISSRYRIYRWRGPVADIEGPAPDGTNPQSSAIPFDPPSDDIPGPQTEEGQSVTIRVPSASHTALDQIAHGEDPFRDQPKRYAEMLLRTDEDAVRAKLIELGWTPPGTALDDPRARVAELEARVEKMEALLAEAERLIRNTPGQHAIDRQLEQFAAQNKWLADCALLRKGGAG